LLPLATKLSPDTLQILNVARYGLSILSIIITIISLIILPDRLFILIALILSLVAIFWDYVVIGVAVGVAVAVVVVIFKLWEESTSWW
jgi:hypothetical protein